MASSRALLLASSSGPGARPRCTTICRRGIGYGLALPGGAARNRGCSQGCGGGWVGGKVRASPPTCGPPKAGLAVGALGSLHSLQNAAVGMLQRLQWPSGQRNLVDSLDDAVRGDRGRSEAGVGGSAQLTGSPSQLLGLPACWPQTPGLGHDPPPPSVPFLLLSANLGPNFAQPYRNNSCPPEEPLQTSLPHPRHPVWVPYLQG